MAKRKTGKASKAEIDFIRKNHERMSDEQMAEKLNRTEAFVRKQRLNAAVVPTRDETDETLAALYNSYYWPEVKMQLIGHEVEYFEKAWLELHRQFSQHGIMASDEISIKDLILHEIATNRALRKKTETLREISELERLIAIEMDHEIEERDAGQLSVWESQRSALIGSLHALTDEIMEYQKKKDEKLKQLKATREARLKNAEQSKSNFWALLRELNTQEKRREWSEYMAKMRMAGQIVELEWSQPIKYEDGKVDKPFLSPEGEMRDAADNARLE